MSIHGQVVVGPPGSGKTTHCRAMKSVLAAFGRRPILVNLDPANDASIRAHVVASATQGADRPASESDKQLFDIDVRELVALEDVMEATGLGPNGGLVYCLDLVLENVGWLSKQLAAAIDDRETELGELQPYLVFDCPGQVEVYTHGTQIKHVLDHLQRERDLRLCGVHLVDASHCSDASKFLSCTMLSLSAMTRMEMPWVNVLSKIDTFSAFGAPPLGLDAYTDGLDLESVLDSAAGPGIGGAPGVALAGDGDGDGDGGGDGADGGQHGEGDRSISHAVPADDGASSPGEAPPADSCASGASSPRAPRSRAFFKRWRSLHRAMVGVMDSYSLVGFLPSTVKDARATTRLLRRCDKATGYAFGALHAATEASVAGMIDRADVDSDTTARREAEEAAMEALLGVM